MFGWMKWREFYTVSCVALTGFLLSSCSFLLDLEQCETDADCNGAGVCSDGICTGNAERTMLSGNITEDTVLTSEEEYQLEGLVFVEPPATLTIEAGTKIYGGTLSALIVSKGARLRSRGTETDPVVFTSAKPVGQRAAGDWGGVALAGQARVNADNPQLEGLSPDRAIVYGAQDDTSSCGVIQHTRIEFGGFAFERDEELNGLTLAGCGSGTTVENVQVHLGKDDGVEVFGGTVKLRNIVISRAQDDSLDWDQGWTGDAQFIVIKQDENGDNAFEASNSADDPNAEPLSDPTIFNVTMIGSPEASDQRGMTLKEGTAGTIGNALIVGHPQEVADVVGQATVTQAMQDNLLLRNSLFFDIGEDQTFFPQESGESDDDGGFDEGAHFLMDEYSNTTGKDPNLPDPYNLQLGGWVPPSSVGGSPATPPTGFEFDESASYIGAFEPGAPDWTLGWTAYPEN
jgi:hypothetical protein